jgi:hypothetical protein
MSSLDMLIPPFADRALADPYPPRSRPTLAARCADPLNRLGTASTASAQTSDSIGPASWHTL